MFVKLIVLFENRNFVSLLKCLKFFNSFYLFYKVLKLKFLFF